MYLSCSEYIDNIFKNAIKKEAHILFNMNMTFIYLFGILFKLICCLIYFSISKCQKTRNFDSYVARIDTGLPKYIQKNVFF